MKRLSPMLLVVVAGAALAEPRRGPPGRAAFIARVDVMPPTGNFGGRTADEILRVVKSRVGLFRACYQKELNRKSPFGGKLVLAIYLDDQGVVTMSRSAGSTLNDPAVEECAKRQVDKLKFKPTGQRAEIKQPLLFIHEAT